MKNLLMLVLVSVFILPAYARTISVIGNGYESLLCSAGPLADTCIRDVKDRAERIGIRDADWRCQASQGQSQHYTANCNSSCFPNYIPPTNGPTIVRCNASCTMECKI